jgi:hypothetical protein
VIHLLAGGSSDLLLNSIALRKREMFDVFVRKELGQGKLFVITTNVTNSHQPSTELVDLITGQVVCRPGEDASMDPNILDNLDNAAAPAVAQKKKPSKRPSQSKKKKEEVEPAVANPPSIPEPKSRAALTSSGQVSKLATPSTNKSSFVGYDQESRVETHTTDHESLGRSKLDRSTIDHASIRGASIDLTQPSDGDNST